MTATLIKVSKVASKYGGEVWLLIFKDINTKISLRTYVNPKNRNYRHWKQIIEDNMLGKIFGALKQKDKTLIDADSTPFIVLDYSQQQPTEADIEKEILGSSPKM